MSDFLKGNFKTRRSVQADEKPAETLEDRFEREALRRLGGSIAFVSKRKVMWDARDATADKDGGRNDKGGAAPAPKVANGQR